ncbi:MAG: phage tail tube protein [Acidaminococcaceae bacterium]|nr:phage tail tube protein [Acidaminococcaceae bacterium]
MSYTANDYPEYSGSSAVAGKKYLLYVKHNNIWNLIGGTRDTGLARTFESIDASTKDEDGWGAAIPGLQKWSGTVSLVVKSTNHGDEIIRAWMNDEELRTERPALLFAFVNTVDKSYSEGFGTVTSYETTGNNGDVMTKSISIEGAGTLTEKSNFAPGNSISPATATFDKADPEDLAFTITSTATSYDVESVKNGEEVLAVSTDYTYSSGTLTIKEEYLADLPNGIVNLAIGMSAGNNLKAKVTVSGTASA